MSKKDIHAQLIEFQIYWNEILNGNHLNEAKIKNLASEIKKACEDPIVRASLNSTEQEFYKDAMIIAGMK